MIDRDELINSWEIFRDKMISALTGKGKQIMLDREKVIKGLGHCDFGVSGTCYEKECPYYQSHDCTDELKNDILVLLKEQEAVKPTWSRGKPFCGACGLRIHGGKFCSECGKPILWESRLYCINCGQELNWNDID